ncbi:MULTISPECIES: LPS export ABC transporter periplasmic protein LptC [Asaia]|uniref:LPS export ABC transporter periplasmic protein LptC n=1 Tax=Asaia TaxID=91914 RepID=UPI002552C8B3|nr:LPS export ABC transporter periplasmic protein LptC [Asaia sp. HumB]MDL2170106.1 LPS export ABC transporter periplasmic protein LptC [Asaia sp. HumB]
MTGTQENKDRKPPQREDFARDAAKLAALREAMREQGQSRQRNIPTSSDLASRRRLLDTAKWALPLTAAVLLGSIAVWPEIARWLSANRAVMQEMAQMRVESGNLEGAIYRGLDAHNRPYMITARIAHQNGPDRVDLVDPVADTHMAGGGWAEIKADKGVYMQHEQTLNLTDHVVLCRDDGTLLNGLTADIDLHRSVIASNDWVHAEGPFGILDAQGYFIDQHANLLQFVGPQRVIRNDDRQDAMPSLTPPARTSSTQKAP